MTEKSDIKMLIQKAQAGDKGALGALFSHYEARFRALAARRLKARFAGGQMTVEEVVQEAQLKACQSIQRFTWQGEDSFFRWLAGITEHILLNRIRQKARAKNVAVPYDLAADVETASTACRRDERLIHLKEALNRLDPDQRKVVICARLKRMPLATIAEQIGRTKGATSQLLMRGIRKLREVMAETESMSLPNRSIDPKEFDHEE